MVTDPVKGWEDREATGWSRKSGNLACFWKRPQTLRVKGQWCRSLNSNR